MKVNANIRTKTSLQIIKFTREILKFLISTVCYHFSEKKKLENTE